MIGTLACWSPQPIFAQTDVTETYLKNPSFENQFTDWENSGMQSQTNTSFQLKEGNTYVERWTGQGGQVADCHVSQTLTTLKNGVYKLTAAAQNIQQNSPATQSGAYVFAGNAQVAVGAANDYSLEFTVIEGQATIGFKTENATGNWVACDNFRLYALNNDLAEIQEELQRRIEKGQALVSEKMQKDVLKELNAALEAARQELNSTTDDNMAPVAIRLRQATEAAQTSIHAYQELQAAIDKSLEAYGDGTLNGAAEFHAVIQEAQALAENLDANAEDLATAVEKLGTALLAFRIANPTGDTPAVVTDTRYARGSTMAFGRSTITGVPETELVEHGFCWSTEPEPTILDNRTTEYIENNGHIYVLRNLTPSTIYYIRAYALTKGYAVGYGDAIKVITIPKGTITWSYNNGGDAKSNARINAAVGSAVEYWNNLTSIQGLHLSVNFGSGTPTADCSYGGWMRVGPNASYQRTGTIMHEMGHAIGVGSHAIWRDGNMRANGNRGDWLGDRANEVLRFWDNNPSAVMTGDNTHMWPYGINGAHEDRGSEALYIANGLITQGLGEDGLPPTGGFSTPAYVFEQEDNVKYYLKNEDEDAGLYSSYLVANPNTTTVKCEEMTAAEAEADDNAAWYITFDPKTSYYSLQNVGTGKYLTYNASRKKFLTKEKDLPAVNEKFHFMKGRIDVNIGTEGHALTTRGYWIIHPEKVLNPNCMGSNAGGRIVTEAFNISNSSKGQRWVILSGEGLQAFDQAIKDERKAELEEMLAHIKALAETPHTEDASGTDAALQTKLSEIEEKANQAETTTEAIATLTEEALAAGMAFLAEATPKSVEHPFDITFLMSDASLKDGEGWSTKPAISFSCGEFFEKAFDFNQTLTALPAGTYQFKGQAFQRAGNTEDVYKAFTAGQDNVNVVIYAGDEEAKIQNIAAEAQTKKLGGSETAVGSNPTRYVPNNMRAASFYFAAELYDNGVVTQLDEDDSKMKVGMRCEEVQAAYWTIFDNFRLYYYGTMSPDQVTSIRQTVADKAQLDGPFATPADVYSLSGIRVRQQATSLDGLPQGIYIVNGYKLVVR